MVHWSLCCDPSEMTGPHGHQVGGHGAVGLRYMKGPPPLSLLMTGWKRIGRIKEDS